MHIRNKFLLISCLVLLSGCSTVQTAKNAQGTGDLKVYSAKKESVWPAMVQSVTSTGGTIKEQDENQCYILASYGMTAWSWGEKVALFCKENNDSTQVEVVMKAALKTNITAVNRAPKIFSSISTALSKK